MARITVEDCLENVNNRFTLIHISAKRVRQLRKGAEPTLVTKNKDIVLSLREVAAGNVLEAENTDETQLIEGETELLSEEASADTIKAEEETAPKDDINEEEQPSEGK